MDHLEAEGPESDGKESLGRRACDQCRLRKIRCDKRLPCSNCRSSQIVCRSTGAGQKPQEPRKRVLISSQYERKIDLIEERLGSIEDLLRELRSNTATTSSVSEPYYHSTPISSRMSPSVPGHANGPAPVEDPEATPAFEGNSSLAAHSAYASEFLETAVSRSALQVSSPTIQAALSTLKQMVSMQIHQAHSPAREVRFPNQKSLLGSGIRDLAMPPVQVVLSLLRQFKENPSILQGVCPFLTCERLIEKCREVYFATEEFSDAAFIVVHGGLYYVIGDCIPSIADPKTRNEYQRYLRLCQTNIETALAHLSICMPARPEYIEALAIGALYAIEMSKPSFALTLTSTASRLCQTLGYHRISSSERDSDTIRGRQLFWTIYTLDKGISLRLGRASTIQDYDITMLGPKDSMGVAEPWNSIYQIWVKFATIQGQVYERLYSPAALLQPEGERADHARRLANDVKENIDKVFDRIMDTQELSHMERIYYSSDKIARKSVLTLIYRAIPPSPDSQSTFVSECIATAREAIELLKETMIEVKELTENIKASYLHWTILYTPFVPFVVLFCHTIATSSWEDLKLLEEFVLCVQPNCFLSEAIAKLYRLCQVLSNVARLYIEAKAQAQAREDQNLMSVGQEFDTYLSALGLAPASTQDGGADWTSAPTAAGAAAVPGAIRSGNEGHYAEGPLPQNQLGNWFSGNQHMMGLLEEDLSVFDPSWTG
ncbi:putative C6 transcription factor [Aspergillus saccharolyticus JOP 1030-1]|uniref:Fungal-specific transcription factor domain protein n=1 Tax=Aspergillus saccharolyticus JOP 1030-1 TaxID=1450539 RepID=A0A318ZMV8_9EURO|nr:fungal-specific transcription factor domain protein [Aspergillus saccharolyticus JOP 1030-1]PYH45753.1 fungal-specific transcription factor domain protein [Aspergillus saccharolyticus JOP 1030-1]